MRKIIITILFFIIVSPLFSQSVFDQFEGLENVSSININKKMFELMSKVKLDTSNKENQQYMNLIKTIDQLKVYQTQNSRIGIQMGLTADKYAKTAGLEELIVSNEAGKKVRILAKQGSVDSQLKELLVFIESGKNEETVLMSVLGNFDLSAMPALIDKMNLPGSAELRRVKRQ
jgi:hypothetical protein